MTLETTLLVWTALALMASISPGPDTLLVAGHAARNGLRAGLAAVAGIITGGFWYMGLLGLGLMSLLAASPTLFAIVKTAGAAYLAYLGVRLLVGALYGKAAAHPSQVSLGAPYRQGLITNALNPKVALFYLAALPQFVGSGPNAPWFGMLLIGIHYVIGGCWLALVAAGAARAGNAVRRSIAMRWIEGLLGTAFLGLAGRLALARNS